MIQFPGTYLLKSENLHFTACSKRSLSEVPADLDTLPCKYIFIIQTSS